MPAPLALAAIGGGSQIASQGINAYTQLRINKKQLEYAEKNYHRQKQDSLDFFNLQNDYNNPSAQMERLRKSGLNPALVYGGGSAQAPSASPNMPDTPKWNPSAPQVDLGGAFTSALNSVQTGQNMELLQKELTAKDVQTNNARLQGELLTQELIMRPMQMTDLQAGTKLKTQKFGQSEGLYPMSLDALKTQMDKIRNDIKLGNNQDNRANQQTYQSLQLGASRLLTDEKTRANMEADNTLKQLTIKLNEKGFTWSDPVYLRSLSKFTDALNTGTTVKDALLKSGLAEQIKAAIGKDAFEYITNTGRQTKKKNPYYNPRMPLGKINKPYLD
ncbi:DNA pilot protein [Antarctic microvirus CAA_003_V_9]|nr:DNA pilot protein [Antarctic microvirus CAA_003_V_9]